MQPLQFLAGLAFLAAGLEYCVPSLLRLLVFPPRTQYEELTLQQLTCQRWDSDFLYVHTETRTYLLR